MSDSEEEAGGFGGSDSEGEGKTLVLTIACCPHLLWTSLATVGVWLGAFLLFLLLPPLSFSHFLLMLPPGLAERLLVDCAVFHESCVLCGGHLRRGYALCTISRTRPSFV